MLNSLQLHWILKGLFMQTRHRKQHRLRLVYSNVSKTFFVARLATEVLPTGSRFDVSVTLARSGNEVCENAYLLEDAKP